MQTLTDAELQFIQNLASGVVGAVASGLVTWVNKRKTKSEEANNTTDTMSRAMETNVNTAKSLVNMLQEMLEEKEKHFIEEIEEAKDDCRREILKYRNENQALVEDLRAKIIALTREKEHMSREMVALTLEKNNQRERVIELTLKLAKYQDSLDEQKRLADNETTDKILD